MSCQQPCKQQRFSASIFLFLPPDGRRASGCRTCTQAPCWRSGASVSVSVSDLSLGAEGRAETGGPDGQMQATDRQVDETYVRVGGQWWTLWRAMERHSQTMDFRMMARRDPRAFLRKAIEQAALHRPVTISTDKAPTYRETTQDEDRCYQGSKSLEPPRANRSTAQAQVFRARSISSTRSSD